jgi:NRAMP (natural resistance-associated macrophage protein)-like metal ion transporter
VTDAGTGPAASPKRRPLSRLKPLMGRLGPGLITGAADDDPSGIATYSQAGAQFGLNMLWTIAFTYPLMVAVQVISARIGRVTGAGLSSNLAQAFPKSVVTGLTALLFVANTINIGADVAAMGAAAQLLLGFGAAAFTIVFALVSLGLQLFVPYHRYVRILKWLTLALFAYVGVVFTVRIDWAQVLTHMVLPDVALNAETLTVVVAVFGTTISPTSSSGRARKRSRTLRPGMGRACSTARTLRPGPRSRGSAGTPSSAWRSRTSSPSSSCSPPQRP